MRDKRTPTDVCGEAIALPALYNFCTSDSRRHRAKGNDKNQSRWEPLGPECRLRRLQNQTKTTTNGQLTFFCLTAPQIKKKINSTTAILDRTYSRVTNSNKVHSTLLKGKEE